MCKVVNKVEETNNQTFSDNFSSHGKKTQSSNSQKLNQDLEKREF